MTATSSYSGRSSRRPIIGPRLRSPIGRSGVVKQLEKLLDDPQVRLKLVQWLAARCVDGEPAEMFDKAMKRFVASQGIDMRVIGCLVRDTEPLATDIEGRARTLAPKISNPGLGELVACYMPIPMDRWKELVAA